MIEITAEVIGKEVIKLIDISIENSLLKSATQLAAYVKLTSGDLIKQRAKKTTGKLFNSITMEANKLPGASTVHIITDIPHSMWAEMGRNAPYWLPYSKKVGQPNYRDFSKSDFKGLNVFRDSIRQVSQPIIFGNIIFFNMIEELKKTGA